jgi:peptidoglycan-associated lipoprotein
MNRLVVGACLMFTSITLGACRRQQVPVPALTTTPSTAPAMDDGAAARRAREQFVQDSIGKAQADAAARAASAAVVPAPAAVSAADADVANLRSMLEAAVRFEYDASELTGEGRMALDAKLPILRTNTALRIRIAGHTDSRGSDEYNLALGLRRASSARKYLADRGIAVGRIDVVSFGEERPAASGDDEGAWAQNRRADFEILSGGESLRVPPR